MAIDNTVNLSQVANQYQKNDILTKPQKYQVNPNGVDKTPEKDTVQLSSGLTTKEKVGIGAAIATGVALITLAVLGRNGHLGEGVQKFLGGKAKKAAQEMGEHTHTPTGTTQVKQETMVTEQVVKPEPVKMEMTDEAKKVYDNVSSKLNQKTEITADTIDTNLKPREKDAVWSAQDRQEYYTQLEQDSLKNKQEAQEILKGIEESRIQANKAEQKAEIAQTVYGVAPLERGLSHKSARESAEVFQAEEMAKIIAEEEAAKKAAPKLCRLARNYTDKNMKELDKLFLDKDGKLTIEYKRLGKINFIDYLKSAKNVNVKNELQNTYLGRLVDSNMDDKLLKMDINLAKQDASDFEHQIIRKAIIKRYLQNKIDMVPRAGS